MGQQCAHSLLLPAQRFMRSLACVLTEWFARQHPAISRIRTWRPDPNVLVCQGSQEKFRGLARLLQANAFPPFVALSGLKRMVLIASAGLGLLVKSHGMLTWHKVYVLRRLSTSSRSRVLSR